MSDQLDKISATAGNIPEFSDTDHVRLSMREIIDGGLKALSSVEEEADSFVAQIEAMIVSVRTSEAEFRISWDNVLRMRFPLSTQELIVSVDRRIERDRKALRERLKPYRNAYHESLRAKFPLAVEMGYAYNRMNEAVKSWFAELNTMRTERLAILARVEAAAEDTRLHQKAVNAYIDAITDTFSLATRPAIEFISASPTDYVTTITVPLPPSLLDNMDQVLDLEDDVHEKVRSVDPLMFGRVGIIYRRLDNES